MSGGEPEGSRPSDSSADYVAKEFTRIYYHILNDNPEYLYQFYGPSSTVTVSETQEDGTNLTVCADNIDYIKSLTLRMFAEVRVRLTNLTPQTSLGGSIQLLVSGVMHQKNCDEERLFTQALLLAKQDEGYYVLNDTVHVHSRSSSWKVLNFREDVFKPKESPPQTTEPEKEIKMETTERAIEPEPQSIEETVEEPEIEPEPEVIETEVPLPEAHTTPQPTVSEDEPVGLPTYMNVQPIEKPVTPMAVPPSTGKRSYKDVLKAKQAAAFAQTK